MRQVRDKSDYFTKSKYVYDIIKDDIISGRFAPNDKLVISSISEELNISDIPVREAMRKLEAEGLVKFVPHIGVTVTDISYEEMKEVVSLRKMLEPYAGKLAAGRLSKEKIERLRKLVDEMDRYIKEDNYQAYGRLNKQFHLEIYEDCGNTTLYNIVKELMNKTERSRAIFRMQPSRMEDSNQEHKALLDALINGDADSAEETIMHQRILSTKRYLDSIDLLKEKEKEKEKAEVKKKVKADIS